GVWVAWIEVGLRGPEVRATLMPGDDGIVTLPLDADVQPVALRFVPGVIGQADAAPVLAMWTKLGALHVTDVDGRPIGAVDPAKVWRGPRRVFGAFTPVVGYARHAWPPAPSTQEAAVTPSDPTARPEWNADDTLPDRVVLSEPPFG